MKYSRFLQLALLASLISLSCKTDNPVEPQPTTPPKIETGATITATTQVVGTAGATINVSSSDILIDGLEITVPENAFQSTRTFNVSYAPIKSHQFGEYFKPISPVITVDNGGGYADSIMTMRIPINLPEGSTAVAFFFDDKTGTLEPIPIIAADESSVTIMTMHFDVSGISASRATKSGASPTDLINYAKIVITYASEVMVRGIALLKPELNTQYVPGIDDWEFTNFGSFLGKARGGHCAGQNASSIWYYYEKKVKAHAPALYNLYDSVHLAADKIWEDNPLGYRVASAVQQEMDWNSTALKIYEDYVGMRDDWTWNALVVSMFLCNEPFAIGAYGKDKKGNSAGHDLTAYKIDLVGRRLFLADPNYSGDRTRTVTFTGTKFNSYFSGATAAESDIEFTSIKFNAKTAVIDWSTIGDKWKSVVEDKQNPGFTNYWLQSNTDIPITLSDYYYTSADTMDVSIVWGQSTQIAFRIFDRKGDRIAPDPATTFTVTDRTVVKLKPGENILGFAVFGETPDGNMLWNDFRWIHVIYGKNNTRIEPATISSTKNKQLEWSAIITPRPTYVRYEWDFGDGKTSASDFDSTVTHSFTNDGDYTIRLVVTDRSTMTKIGEAQATASIHSGPMIDSVTPNMVSFGTTVSIRGSGFGTSQGSGTLKFGELAPYSVLLWTDGHIIAAVPEMFSNTKNYITVSVNGIESDKYYVSAKQPKIASFSPDSAQPGALLTIHGDGFGIEQGSATVAFSPNDPATVISWSDTIVTVLVPEPYAKSYGKYWITLKLGNTYSDAHPFIIVENILNTLHETDCFNGVVFEARELLFYSSPTPHNDYTNMYNQIQSNSCQTSKMIWDKRNFALTISNITSTDTTITLVNGTVSVDGKILATLNSSVTYHGRTSRSVLELDFTNIPLKESVAIYSRVTYSMTGPELASHLKNMVYEYWSPTYQSHYIETDWTSTIKVPYFALTFVKS